MTHSTYMKILNFKGKEPKLKFNISANDNTNDLNKLM